MIMMSGYSKGLSTYTYIFDYPLAMLHPSILQKHYLLQSHYYGFFYIVLRGGKGVPFWGNGSIKIQKGQTLYFGGYISSMTCSNITYTCVVE